MNLQLERTLVNQVLMANLKNISDFNVNASAIALEFISFLTQDDDRLMQFFALTGAGLNDLKEQIETPVFQALVLDYALSDETLLVSFAESINIRPENIMRARSALPGFEQ